MNTEVWRVEIKILRKSVKPPYSPNNPYSKSTKYLITGIQRLYKPRRQLSTTVVQSVQTLSTVVDNSCTACTDPADNCRQQLYSLYRPRRQLSTIVVQLVQTPKTVVDSSCTIVVSLFTAVYGVLFLILTFRRRQSWQTASMPNAAYARISLCFLSRLRY